KLQKEMNMPTKLTQCKLSLEDITNEEREIAKLAIKDTCTLTNPKVPTEDDIINILKNIK
ncbi:alcohol dehydrogenase, partial [Clostridioides difficile]|nr:alcohol dehydrogenase [Clostridioides difficile]